MTFLFEQIRAERYKYHSEKDGIFLATKHNAQKIANEKIEQIFMANNFFEIGKIGMNYNKVLIIT